MPYPPIKYNIDDACNLAITKNNKSSHLKIYLPSIPYSQIMRIINGTLVRLNDSKKGWEFFIAKSLKKIDSLTYDFVLREDVFFQDGTKLTADSIVENFKYFKKGAFTYTDIHNRLKNVEKLSKYKIRINLLEPYGMLLNDLARINLYTTSYLKKYAWSKNIIGDNTKVPGAYGSGPYILEKGFAVGLEQSDVIELKVNPYYFEKNKPHIERITIFTKLPIDEVIEKISKKEAELDIAFIPANKKTEIVNSKYAKLISKESTTNLTIQFNLMRKNSIFQNQDIRQALNQAINQKRLIKFSYKNEGKVSPFMLSSNSFYSTEISQKYLSQNKKFFSKKQLHKILNNLTLNVVTQDRFMYIWKGIEYQLKKYGVKLKYDVTSDESYVLNKLLTNRKYKYKWDLLIWGNADWYGHPWNVFFTLYTKNQWSAINEDKVLDKKLQKLFEIESTKKEFQDLVNEILEYTYKKAYILKVPTPNTLLAVNKEVCFIPNATAILRLWDTKVTPFHWSIRGSQSLPKNRTKHIYPIRFKHNE